MALGQGCNASSNGARERAEELDGGLVASGEPGAVRFEALGRGLAIPAADELRHGALLVARPGHLSNFAEHGVAGPELRPGAAPVRAPGPTVGPSAGHERAGGHADDELVALRVPAVAARSKDHGTEASAASRAPVPLATSTLASRRGRGRGAGRRGAE